MTTTVLVWALWVVGGGYVNGRHLKQPYVAAYFASEQECTRVQAMVHPYSGWTQCIQAGYIIQGQSKP